jgi:hypothetical protein
MVTAWGLAHDLGSGVTLWGRRVGIWVWTEYVVCNNRRWDLSIRAASSRRRHALLCSAAALLEPPNAGLYSATHCRLQCNRGHGHGRDHGRGHGRSHAGTRSFTPSALSPPDLGARLGRT